jgi:hypothetical protein
MFKGGERKVAPDMAVFMIAIAFAFDLINICVEYFTFGVGGIIMDFITGAIFFLWFQRYDINLFGNRNTSLTLLAGFVDMVPGGDFFFPWTWRVGLAVLNERKEVPKEAKVSVSPWRL